MPDSTGWYTAHSAEPSYTVSTADELSVLADIVNGDAKGVKRFDFSGKTVTLAADIDLSGYADDGGWSPIGNKYVDIGDGIDDRVFAGTFDGCGHVIKNLIINRPEGHYQGLFGCVSGGVAKNFRLVGANIRGANFVGGVAGYVSGGGSVVNCHSAGEIAGNIAVGGIVGRVNGGVIDDCCSTVAVSGEKEIGGLVGSVHSGDSDVTNCVARNSSVKSTRNRPEVGRIAGKIADGATLSNNAEPPPSAPLPPPPPPPPVPPSIPVNLGRAAQLPRPQPAAAATEVIKDSGFTDPIAGIMVAVKGGTFMMGATEEQGGDCYDDEKPARLVTLSDYHIGKFPVTQRLWKRIMAGTPLADPSRFKGDDLPVETVCWKDIVGEFLRRLNSITGKAYRLPTEAEWEYAARGGQKSKGYKYAGGNDIDGIAWYGGNSGRKTRIVGTKAPNELGIYDMSGNVWEWVNDRYGKYGADSQANPRGALSGTYRVNRGGSWSSAAGNNRVSSRRNDFPDAGNDLVGFRLAL